MFATQPGAGRHWHGEMQSDKGDKMPDTGTVMAISEDRQWLAVLNKEPYQRQDACYYAIYEWSDFLSSYQWRDLVANTGQRAEEALRAFLAGRE